MTDDPTINAALEKLARTARSTKARKIHRRMAWLALSLDKYHRPPAPQSPSWKRCIALACVLAPLWSVGGATIAALVVL